MMRKLINLLSSSRLMGILVIGLAVSIAIATFIENDFGSETAKALVYNTLWFECILLLLAINIGFNIVTLRLFKREKITQGILHLSFIVIIIGAAITRYFGFEGIMHIREGESSNVIISDRTYLLLEAGADNQEFFSEEIPVYLSEAGNNRLSRSVSFNGDEFEITLRRYIPAAVQRLEENAEKGYPVIALVVSGKHGREDIFLQKNDTYPLGPFTIKYADEKADTANRQMIVLYTEGNAVKVSIPVQYKTMPMLTQQQDTHLPGTSILADRTLYTVGTHFFVFKSFQPNGVLLWHSAPKSARQDGVHYSNRLVFEVSHQGISKELTVMGNKGIAGEKSAVVFNDKTFSVAYGAKTIALPFTLTLRDFMLEKYPGSSSPSSFESYITLDDKERQLHRDQKIFMNNVMDYRGYRFFQSSYDRDELGTVLSVNHDRWGTYVTYFGYFLLSAGMIFGFFNPNGRLRSLGRKIQRQQVIKTAMRVVALPLLLQTGTLLAAPAATLALVPRGHMLQRERVDGQFISQPDPNDFIVDKQHAGQFGSLIVQGHNGRFKPVATLATEVVRKVTKKEHINGWTPTQLFIGMSLFPKQFVNVPMIRVNSHDLSERLGITGKYASFSNFWDKETGTYLIAESVKAAHHKKPAYRTKQDNELIKVDERVNICYSIFDGSILRLFLDNNSEEGKWLTTAELIEKKGDDFSNRNQNYNAPASFAQHYTSGVRRSLKTGDWRTPSRLTANLISWQRDVAGDLIPSATGVKAEILYNKANLFQNLMRYYLLLGVVVLGIYLLGIFRPAAAWVGDAIKALSYVLMLGVFLHTLGLGLRWHISGHAPWSDGYESLIYISWASLLAGLLFYKRFPITLAFTGIFAGLCLWVASLSLFDEQITNLVPVLKSYWLTIHVSMITASYGFFGLGAMVALFNLLAMLLKNIKTKDRLDAVVKALTDIMEMTITLGLVLLSIGTFLGGIWANESWGRYWGWDPKESWALVSILVYSFVIHARFIPGLRGIVTLNVLTAFAFYAILMTYLGVNFFLSGLHSYAAGDPVPIPVWAYVSVGSLVLLSATAYLKERYF